jgi:multiple sugar transport system permease protein
MSIDLELQQAAIKYKNKQKVKDRFISAFIGVFAIVWIFPIVWTVWTSLRPYKDVRAHGVFSMPKT